MKNQDLYTKTINCFVNVIGYLQLILQFDTYQEDFDTYNEMSNDISKWASLYERKRTLDFLDFDTLKNIYEKADNLQTKYICNDKMGSESEFSDYVVNLLWKLRVLYKKHLKKENE